MPYVYILRCSDASYYVGSTWDLERRVGEHNLGLGAEYTKRRRPVLLVWSSQVNRIDEAYRVEKQVQGWSRAKREALMEGRFEDLPALARTAKTRNAGVVSTSSTDEGDETDESDGTVVSTSSTDEGDETDESDGTVVSTSSTDEGDETDESDGTLVSTSSTDESRRERRHRGLDKLDQRGRRDRRGGGQTISGALTRASSASWSVGFCCDCRSASTRRR